MSTGSTPTAAAVLVLAALVGVVVAQGRRVRALRAELTACREDAIALEERWHACRAELREAQRLE